MTTTTSPPPALPPSALASMDAADFEAFVSAAISRSTAPAVWDALAAPEVNARTRLVLAAMHTDVQNQLNLANANLQKANDEGFARGDGRQAYFAARTEQAEWRRKAAGFRPPGRAADRLRQVPRYPAPATARRFEGRPSAQLGSA